MLDPKLECFLAVATEGSIRKASEKLNIAASAVSRKITGIEEDLGVPLFERHARGLRLTEAGEIFADHTRKVMRHESWALGEIEALRNLQRGQLRIFCVEGTITSLITPAIAAFRKKAPDVKLTVTRSGSTGVMRAVAADEADLGLAFDPPKHRDVTVVAEVPAPLYAVSAPEFSLPDRAVSLAELSHLPISIPQDSSYGIRDVIDQGLRARADVTLDPPMQCDSVYGLMGFALTGQGVTILPKCCFEQEEARGQLVARPISDPPFCRSRIALVSRLHRNLPPLTRRFSAILAQVMRESAF